MSLNAKVAMKSVHILLVLVGKHNVQLCLTVPCILVDNELLLLLCGYKFILGYELLVHLDKLLKP